VDTEGARKTLLTEPRIREAVVGRRFPDTVVLQVKEREPLACLPQNGLFFLVDGEGMVYASCGQKPQGAVELHLSPAPTLYAGRELDDLGVQQVLEALKGAPGLAAMAEVAGREERGIYLVCQGVKVILGDIRDLQRKEIIALGALKTAAARGEVLDYVDVRLPEHPVWKPRG
jgi:cell division protein FtsQ